MLIFMGKMGLSARRSALQGEGWNNGRVEGGKVKGEGWKGEGWKGGREEGWNGGTVKGGGRVER